MSEQRTNKRSYAICIIFLAAFLSLCFLPASFAAVELIYKDVDQTQEDNPHVTGVQSNSSAKITFQTAGPLGVNDDLTSHIAVTVVNGDFPTDEGTGAEINDVRFSTASVVQPFIDPATSGVTMTLSSAAGVWHDPPGNGQNQTGFGFGMNNQAVVPPQDTKQFNFVVSSGDGGLTYQDWLPGSGQFAKGTVDKDVDSFYALKWKGEFDGIKHPITGNNIPGQGLFSGLPPDIVITDELPVASYFDATGISRGEQGVKSFTVDQYGTIFSRTIKTENSNLILEKIEKFTHILIPQGVNTVGILAKLKPGMADLLNFATASGDVDDVMKLKIKLNNALYTELNHGEHWGFGYWDSDPDRLYAFLVPGSQDLDPFINAIKAGEFYGLELSFIDYANIFGTSNHLDITSVPLGEQGIVGNSLSVVPELPSGWLMFFAFFMGLLVLKLRQTHIGKLQSAI